MKNNHNILIGVLLNILNILIRVLLNILNIFIIVLLCFVLSMLHILIRMLFIILNIFIRVLLKILIKVLLNILIRVLFNILNILISVLLNILISRNESGMHELYTTDVEAPNFRFVKSTNFTLPAVTYIIRIYYLTLMNDQMQYAVMSFQSEFRIINYGRYLVC